jgi:hypothetical protein
MRIIQPPPCPHAALAIADYLERYTAIATEQ